MGAVMGAPLAAMPVLDMAPLDVLDLAALGLANPPGNVLAELDEAALAVLAEAAAKLTLRRPDALRALAEAAEAVRGCFPFRRDDGWKEGPAREGGARWLANPVAWAVQMVAIPELQRLRPHRETPALLDAMNRLSAMAEAVAKSGRCPSAKWVGRVLAIIARAGLVVRLRDAGAAA